MALHTYPITIEREGKQYYAYSDDFPGVYGLGPSIEAAKKGILEAMRLWIEHTKKLAAACRRIVPFTPRRSPSL